MAIIKIQFNLASGVTVPNDVKVFAKLIGDTSGMGRVRVNFGVNPQKIGELLDNYTSLKFIILDRNTYETMYNSVTFRDITPDVSNVAGTNNRVAASTLIIQTGMPQSKKSKIRTTQTKKNTSKEK